MVRFLFVLSALAVVVLSAPAPQLGALTGLLGGLGGVGGLGGLTGGASGGTKNNGGDTPKTGETSNGDPLGGLTKAFEGSSVDGLPVPL